MGPKPDLVCPTAWDPHLTWSELPDLHGTQTRPGQPYSTGLTPDLDGTTRPGWSYSTGTTSDLDSPTRPGGSYSTGLTPDLVGTTRPGWSYSMGPTLDLVGPTAWDSHQTWWVLQHGTHT
ncbi:hypothetical protein NHX12_009363 [Muraenolepis orangiensis]|uniref:Uncharacterized protein n=1 Tax=Muraenolepis orangiensis TaxID=630683 RepID=A0A9Q0IB44_9TELE|nr:hypothetical protein NHX12_009363 [Muraenolepis orangiensis]